MKNAVYQHWLGVVNLLTTYLNDSYSRSIIRQEVYHLGMNSHKFGGDKWQLILTKYHLQGMKFILPLMQDVTILVGFGSGGARIFLGESRQFYPYVHNSSNYSLSSGHSASHCHRQVEWASFHKFTCLGGLVPAWSGCRFASRDPPDWSEDAGR
jgi:hypothetical protein